MKITELRLLDLASRMGVPAESRGSAQQATERAGQTLAHLGASLLWHGFCLHISIVMRLSSQASCH